MNPVNCLLAAILATAFFAAGQGNGNNCASSVVVPEQLVATNWTQCPNQTDYFNPSASWPFGVLECRTITYQGTYIANRSGITHHNLERRWVKGVPKTVVYLIAGGPGDNADRYALSTVNNVDEALQDNYAVYVPNLRGTLYTTNITQNGSFPLNLRQTLQQNPSYTDYSVTNTAIDLLLSMRQTRGVYKTATLNAIAFGFGTYVAQRIMTIEPNFLDAAILDSAYPPVNASNVFAVQAYGSGALSNYLFVNCNRDPFCSQRTLPRPKLVSFVESLNVSSNGCVDAYFASAGMPNLPPALQYQILRSLIYSWIARPNIALPPSLLLNTTTQNNVFVQQVIQAYVETFALDYPSPDKVYIDTRSVLLAFLNQLAQCGTTPAKQAAFAASMESISKVSRLFRGMANRDLSPNSIMGQNQITSLLMQLSEGRLPNASVSDIKSAAQGSLLHPGPVEYDYQQILQNQTGWVPSFTDCYSNTMPRPVGTRVVVLAGRLDPIIPFDQIRLAFASLKVNGAAGGRKTFYIHNNAGHQVIGNGYSSCTNFLIRAVLLANAAANTRYQGCLQNENVHPIDWELADLPQAVNASRGMWVGLDSDFTPGPTLAPTSQSPTSPTTLSPTFQPTIAPTQPITKSPTSAKPTLAPISSSPTTGKPTLAPVSKRPSTARPSRAPTTFKSFCNSFTSESSCTNAKCVWRPNRSTCTTGIV